MTDRDGDSRMQGQDESDSEGSSQSSNIFPHETMSTPPQSQSINITATEKEDTLMGEAGDHLSSGVGIPNSSATRTNPAGNVIETDENAPGWAWRNRRAIEEFDKSSDAVLDKHFSLEEFGDIVMERLREQEEDYDPYASISSFIEGGDERSSSMLLTSTSTECYVKMNRPDEVRFDGSSQKITTT